jgi:hypothetical protein
MQSGCIADRLGRWRGLRRVPQQDERDGPKTPSTSGCLSSARTRSDPVTRAIGPELQSPPGATAPRVDGTISPSGKHGGRPTGYEKNIFCVLLRTHQQHRRAVGGKMLALADTSKRVTATSRRNQRAVAVWQLFSNRPLEGHPNRGTSCRPGWFPIIRFSSLDCF